MHRQKKQILFIKQLCQKTVCFFSVAYNSCNMLQMENMLSEGFEFYHDKGGFANKKEIYN